MDGLRKVAIKPSSSYGGLPTGKKILKLKGGHLFERRLEPDM